jgi:DNA-binding MarR family transcriptional regulator
LWESSFIGYNHDSNKNDNKPAKGIGVSRTIVADDPHRSKEEGDTTTDRILKYIQDNPGCHLRQIKGELRLAMGTVQYQLDRLEKAGKIRSKRRGLYKYYFSVGVLDNEEDILEVLTQETAREILMFIIERGNPTQTEISSMIKISSPSVNWHIKRLTELGLINQKISGKYKRYHLLKDSKLVIALLRSYYPSLWDQWSNRLVEMFLSMSSAATEEGEEGEKIL